MTQGPHQDVQYFVHNVQEKARGLSMQQADLVSIILNCVDLRVKKYLVMDRPASIQDILKSPATLLGVLQEQDSATTLSSILAIQGELWAFGEQLKAITTPVQVEAATVPPENQDR